MSEICRNADQVDSYLQVRLSESSPKFKDFDSDFASCWFRSLTSMRLMIDVGRILTVCEFKRVDEEEGDGGKLEVGIKSFLSSNENIKY